MQRSRTAVVPGLILVAALSTAWVVAQERPGDKGETPEARALQSRSTDPKATDIDAAATLDSLLAKGGKSAFSQSRGATVEGYVVQIEREEDGDYHVTLAAAAGEPDSRKWMIVEVTPAWQKKGGDLAPAKLRQLHGKKIRVTGWLYYEPDEDQPDPRGTKWEIHPVTSITVVVP
jgi:hypothetical protein